MYYIRPQKLEYFILVPPPPHQEPGNPYEAQKVVDEYMAFHYCPADEYLVHPTGPKVALDFPQRCAQLCLKHQQVRRRGLRFQLMYGL